MVMKSREPFQLKHPMMVYNFCLVILNAYIFYEVGFQELFGLSEYAFSFKCYHKKKQTIHTSFSQNTIFLTFNS